MMHTSETTNGKIGEVIGLLDTLIGWAEADAEHARKRCASYRQG